MSSTFVGHAQHHAAAPTATWGAVTGRGVCALQEAHSTLVNKVPVLLICAQVGAMLLGVTPPGSSMLLPAAKMLYGLSKDSSNDSRFRHHGVLRPLLQMTAALSTAMEQQRQQPHTGTALLYCSGCLKNASADATNQRSLGRLGGVSTMAQVGVKCSARHAGWSASEIGKRYPNSKNP